MSCQWKPTMDARVIWNNETIAPEIILLTHTCLTSNTIFSLSTRSCPNTATIFCFHQPGAPFTSGSCQVTGMKNHSFIMSWSTFQPWNVRQCKLKVSPKQSRGRKSAFSKQALAIDARCMLVPTKLDPQAFAESKHAYLQSASSNRHCTIVAPRKSACTSFKPRKSVPLGYFLLREARASLRG